MGELKDQSEEDMENIGLTGKCDFCGDEAKFYWVQGTILEFCEDCALTFFPRFLADLTSIESYDQTNQLNPDELLDKIEKVYWKAVSSKFRSDWVRKDQ